MIYQIFIESTRKALKMMPSDPKSIKIDPKVIKMEPKDPKNDQLKSKKLPKGSQKGTKR